MKKMFRNSSGLLELVLVGLIIAILFIIVVPTILERISTSKKNGYIDMVKMYVEAARMDNPYELNQAIMISFEQLEPFLESGGSSSSYGNEWDTKHSFVVVVNEGTTDDSSKYTYYVAAWDGKHALGDATKEKSEARIILENDLTAENVVNTTEGVEVSSNSKYSKKVSASGVSYLALDPDGTIQMFTCDD